MPKLTPPPDQGKPWQLFKLPQTQPGDNVISASSGRILQNEEGKLTEVPHGLRVPFIGGVTAGSPKTFKEVEKVLEQYATVINHLVAVIDKYNMSEANGEVDPE